jgi:hypothetical protein
LPQRQLTFRNPGHDFSSRKLMFVVLTIRIEGALPPDAREELGQALGRAFPPGSGGFEGWPRALDGIPSESRAPGSCDGDGATVGWGSADRLFR